MRKDVFAMATLAAFSFAGGAFAAEDNHSGNASAPKAMTDSELDNVTAGNPTFLVGLGAGTGFVASGSPAGCYVGTTPGKVCNAGPGLYTGTNASAPHAPGGFVGVGKNTAFPHGRP